MAIQFKALQAFASANILSLTAMETINLDEPARLNGRISKYQRQSLGVIINQYKRICTIQARKINQNFAWQSQYYERIIRDDESYRRIFNYIKNNPGKYRKASESDASTINE